MFGRSLRLGAMTMSSVATGYPRFSFGKTLSDTFTVIGANFRTMALLVLILYAAPMLVYSLVAYQWTRALLEAANPLTAFVTIGPAMMVGTIVSMLLYVISQIALTWVTLRGTAGHRPMLGEALAATLRFFLPGLGVLLIFYLILAIVLFGFGMFFVVVVGATAAAGDGGGALAAVGMTLLAIPVFVFLIGFLSTVFIAALPACMAEPAGVLASFGRSWRLTRGNRWKVFALLLLIGIGAMLVSGSVSLAAAPMMLAGFPTGAAASPVALLPMVALQTIGNSIMLLVLYPLTAAIYVNLRESKEGVAHDRIADIFG